MSNDSILRAVKDLVHTVDMEELGALAMRQMFTLEEITRLVREVADDEPVSSQQYDEGYHQGQVDFALKIAEKIKEKLG
jgi:hypothetical protein